MPCANWASKLAIESLSCYPTSPNVSSPSMVLSKRVALSCLAALSLMNRRSLTSFRIPMPRCCSPSRLIVGLPSVFASTVTFITSSIPMCANICPCANVSSLPASSKVVSHTVLPLRLRRKILSLPCQMPPLKKHSLPPPQLFQPMVHCQQEKSQCTASMPCSHCCAASPQHP